LSYQKAEEVKETKTKNEVKLRRAWWSCHGESAV